MSQQISLLDLCKLPDVQIHSKTGLLKYLINKESEQMMKLRENIVRLSYTSKVIGVKGDEVGIVSKRLPLKYKEPQESINTNSQQFVQSNAFVPHKNFYVCPLPTVKKQSESKTKTISQANILNTVNQNQYMQTVPYKRSNALIPRSKSMAKVRIFEKRQSRANQQITKSKLFYLQRKTVRSYSNLLKQFHAKQNQNLIISPIDHEGRPLFKRLERLTNRDKKQPMQNQQMGRD